MAKNKDSLLTPWLWLIIGSIIALVFVITLAAFTQNSYLGARLLNDPLSDETNNFEDCLNLQNDFELCADIYEQDLLDI